VAVTIRASLPGDRADVDATLAAAFEGEPEVVALERDLSARPDSVGFVAETDGAVVGFVRLTRGWIDAEAQLVEIVVLSPLGVLPGFQRQGIGAALTAHAVEHAQASGAPAVFLEGSPRYYGRLGWRPAAELGVTPPSARIPTAAFQAIRLSHWEAWICGPLVYADPFWVHDCVGLRGERLETARRALAEDAPR
jgi:putative acetyltransferase